LGAHDARLHQHFARRNLERAESLVTVVSRLQVNLSTRQVRDPQAYIDRTRSCAKLGSVGMLVAQIRWDQEGRVWLEPAFLEHTHAKILTEHGKTLEQVLLVGGTGG